MAGVKGMKWGRRKVKRLIRSSAARIKRRQFSYGVAAARGGSSGQWGLGRLSSYNRRLAKRGLL